MDCERPKSTASYSPPSPASPDPEAGDSGRVRRADALVGQLLANRFEVLEPLGAGSFGEVYKARDRENPGEAVAVKVLRHPSPAALYRFKREFRALGELSHPNLVVLHELFLDASSAFFTMELIAGVDFHNYVRPAGVLHPERLVRALRGLCDGVDALHDAGWLHRDLKPSNVLVEETGRVAIVDFGLATLLEPASDSGSELGFVGTAHYAAPEQLSLGRVGQESDWYAIGTMLYEALNGALPYEGPFHSLFDAKSRPPPALAEQPEALRALAGVCMDMLEPEQRARAGGAALRAVLGHAPAAHGGARELPFVGRAAQLAELQQLFREVEEGAALGALVLAPSGLGKTSLVDRFLDGLRARHGALVLRGRCYVNEEVAYQAIDGSIDALSHHLCSLPLAQTAALLPRDARSLACLFPVLNRVASIASAPPIRTLSDDRASLRERAGEALRELLARLSDRVPLVLCVDDVQWDDADSAWLLSALLGDPEPPALLLIAICRSEAQEQSHLLRALRGSPLAMRRIREVSLPALSFDETTQLAAHGSDEAALDAQVVARIASESGGHPLFALELVRWAQRNRGLDVQPSELSLDAAIRGRAAALSDAARRLLEIVCTAGHPLKCRVAARAADCQLGVLREITSRKLVSASGLGSEDDVEVYHDRVREALLAALGDERVRALRVMLAEALLHEPQPRFDVIVEHYLAAGQPQRAAEYALKAADHAASVLAFHRVPELLRLSVSITDETQRGCLYVRLGEACALVGRAAEAARAYEQAADLEPEPAQAWELRSMAMWQALLAGELALGFALLRELDARFGRRGVRPSMWRMTVGFLRGLWWYAWGPPQLRAPDPARQRGDDRMRMELAFRAAIGLVGGSAVHALYYSVLAFQLAAKLGDAGLYALLLAILAAGRGFAGGRPSRRTERLLDRARELVEAQPDRTLQIFVAQLHVAYAGCTGQAERAERELALVLDAPLPATPLGSFVRTLLRTMDIPSSFWRGRIARVRTYAAREIDRARELANRRQELWLRAMSAFRLLADDDAETAWAEWQFVCDQAIVSEVTWGMVPALYAGRTDRAEQVLASTGRVLLRWEAHVSFGRNLYLWWWGVTAAARLAAGETGWRLRWRLRVALWLLGTAAPPTFAALVPCMRAIQASLHGRPERAVAQLERGHALLVGSGLRLFAACAAHALAGLHSNAQQRAEYAAHARAFFDQERIACPERWQQALLPGLPVSRCALVHPEQE